EQFNKDEGCADEGADSKRASGTAQLGFLQFLDGSARGENRDQNPEKHTSFGDRSIRSRRTARAEQGKESHRQRSDQGHVALGQSAPGATAPYEQEDGGNGQNEEKEPGQPGSHRGQKGAQEKQENQHPSPPARYLLPIRCGHLPTTP